MNNNKVIDYIQNVIENKPSDWLLLTTHRLDIYNEEKAKTDFIDQLDSLFQVNDYRTDSLQQLPTAYDYIRLGHPLSSVLEWGIAQLNNTPSENIISFSSRSIPVLAVLRKNLIDNKNTLICYTEKLPAYLDFNSLKSIYGYQFELKQVADFSAIPSFDGSTIFVSQQEQIGAIDIPKQVDFFVSIFNDLGSILYINGIKNTNYISAIQHVRRRETIAMTPINCLAALELLLGKTAAIKDNSLFAKNKAIALDAIKTITATTTKALLGSSGLSMQYAIMMGLIDHAFVNHPGKNIKIIVPPNCYGGTNDQARRVAACIKNVAILDLPVDGDHDMVQSTNKVLELVAQEDAVPYIIAEIPTNPRVEVPDLDELKTVLSKKRLTKEGKTAIAPVFILDQTFCPNVQFLADNGMLSSIQTIAYVSGSKFPSGGKVTAGYCAANKEAAHLLEKINKHLIICDNEATDHQVATLAVQLPSMNQRIKDAYANTRDFVNFIQKELPQAKINFVSDELAEQGFTPSVFSLDLPTKGATHEEREEYKRTLNQKLIHKMIGEIPHESKYCVSYGQLKGCYWTIPATSTQGTTKEADKDYIARVSVSPNLDLELHKAVFSAFVKEEIEA